MDVRVEAVSMLAGASINEVQTTVEAFVTIVAPVVSRFYSSPVISIGGTSISSIQPETLLRREKAIA